MSMVFDFPTTFGEIDLSDFCFMPFPRLDVDGSTLTFRVQGWKEKMPERRRPTAIYMVVVQLPSNKNGALLMFAYPDGHRETMRGRCIEGTAERLEATYYAAV